MNFIKGIVVIFSVYVMSLTFISITPHSAVAKTNYQYFAADSDSEPEGGESNSGVDGADGSNGTSSDGSTVDDSTVDDSNDSNSDASNSTNADTSKNSDTDSSKTDNNTVVYPPQNLKAVTLYNGNTKGRDIYISFSRPTKIVNAVIVSYLVKVTDIISNRSISQVLSKDATSVVIKDVLPAKYKIEVSLLTNTQEESGAFIYHNVKILRTTKATFFDLKGMNKSRTRAVDWLGKTAISVGTSCPKKMFKKNSKLSKSSVKCFLPQKPMNRGAMAELLYMFAGASQKQTNSVYFRSDKVLNKIKSRVKIRYDRIQVIAEKGFTIGCGPTLDSLHIGYKTLFCPNDIVTRGQMASFLYKFAGQPQIDGMQNVFTNDKDVERLKRFDYIRYNSIVWLGNMQISIGTKEDSKLFKPNDNLNRGSMAEFLQKLYYVLETGVKCPTEGVPLNFN